MEYGYILNPITMDQAHYEQFQGYMEQYKNAPNRQILSEIMRVRSEVSQDVLDAHMKNLELMGQMEGYSTAETQQRIVQLKQMLAANPPAASSQNVETAFWGGTSLLLWFLLLTAIWPRTYIGRPGYGYPGYPRYGFR